jgi:hypothetical protein
MEFVDGTGHVEEQLVRSQTLNTSDTQKSCPVLLVKGITAPSAQFIHCHFRYGGHVRLLEFEA